MNAAAAAAGQNWRLGLTLACTTAVLWATLPIALKSALEVLDFWTLTWFRFAVAWLCTLLWLLLRRQVTPLLQVSPGARGLLAVAALGLIGNYVLYLLGLKYTSPANAQLLIQLAPLLLALGAAWIFRERLSGGQWLGFSLITTGLLGFFFDQQQHAVAVAYGWGAALIVLAAISWAGYGLAQKALQRQLNSQQILLVIYTVATVLLAPLATPSRLLELDAAHAWAVAYCCFNTVAAYGAFAEAMAQWQAARVSAVLATTPLLTLGVVWLVHPLWPHTVAPEHLGWMGVAGAVAVVSGSMLASLARRSA